MSEPLTPSEPLAQTDAQPPHHAMDDARTMPIVVYVLYLLGFASGLITTVAGLVVAYSLKSRAGEIGRSHYVFQIRTIWIGLLWLALAAAVWLVGLPLTVILIGLAFWWVAGVMLAILCVWFVVRCIVGLIFIGRNEPYPRPQAWLI